MLLVYLIAGLPRVRRGEPPPIPRAELVRRCRAHLEGPDRAELELLVQTESVEETVRLSLAAELAGLDAEATVASIVNDRRDGVPLGELRPWILRPGPQHELLRRHYQDVTERARTDFLRSWASFRVDIGEVITAVLCRQEGMTRDDFLVQMQGSFDSSAPRIIANWEEPGLGLGTRFPWLPRVLAALEDDDLLAMSRALDDVLWERIEALTPTDTFRIETVLALYLHLRICERQAQWNAERGAQVLDRMLAATRRGTPPNAPSEAPR
jgi:hypothetical protein